MNKKTRCPVGKSWDALVGTCVNRPEPKPPTEPPVVVQLKSTVHSAQANSVMELSPALWLCVMVATVGSVVALVVWFVIYRRKTSLSNAPEDAEAQQEPLQKTEPPAIFHSLPSERYSHAEMLQRAAGAPCPHLHLGAQTVSQWEEGFTAYRDTTKHAGTEGGGGLPPCSTMREHRIPLPATELGGTALVTTKTM